MTNLPFLRQILTSKNESEPTFSFSTVKVYVLMFRGHTFAKRVGRFRWFKKYKNIINIPSIKTWFKFYGTFIQQVFLMMWKKNVSQYWTERGPHSSTICLNIKLVVKRKNWFLFVKRKKWFLFEKHGRIEIGL